VTAHVWRKTIVLFAIMVAHALLETARDAILLGTLGPSAVAVAYIIIAAVAVVTLVIMRKLGGTRRPGRLLVVFLAGAAVGTPVLASALSLAPRYAFVLYGWSGVVATLVVPTFWLTADRGVNVMDAKRGFGLIASGGVAGALAGSASALGLAQVLDPRHLATASGVAFAIAAVVALVVLPATVADRAQPPLAAHDLRAGRSRGYLRLLLLVGLVSTVTLTLGDMMFKRALAERLPAESLASWLAAIYTGLNVIALVVQVAATARLLRHGVGMALTVLPSLMLATALGFAMTGALVAVIALKLADGGLRYSLHRVGLEILYIPVPATVRQGAKPIVDAIAQRGGQALAALIAIAFVTETRGLSYVIVAGVVLWLVAVAFTRAAYVQQFRTTLEAHDIQRDVRVTALDRASIDVLMGALASPDEAEASAALDLLAMSDEGIPALVLYHPSPAIVRRALRSLRGELRPDLVRVLQELVTHRDPEVRGVAIAAANRGGCAPPPAGLDDPEPHVRAATAVALNAGPHAAQAQDTLNALLEGTTAERLALALAIGNDPRGRFRGVLVHLLSRREPSVTRAVLKVWQQVPALADASRLLALLGYAHVRGDARRALLAVGSLAHLIAALENPRTPIGIRRQLPRTIAGFHSPAAAVALAAHLVREPDGTTELKILRALGRMRADEPQLSIRKAPVHAYILRSLEDAARYRRLWRAVSGKPAPTLALLAELLDEIRHNMLERVFRALGILYPLAGMRSVHDALVAGDGERQSAAREILDDSLPVDLRTHLIEELDGHDRGHRALPSLDDALRALLSDSSDTLRCFAAYHVAQSNLVELRDELVRLKPTTGSMLVTLAFDQAIASLHA
jgi:ATP/ADP translocase